MPRGNPADRITITIDPDLRARAATVADEQGLSLSAFITDAVRGAHRYEEGMEGVRAYEREFGEITDDEIGAAVERMEARDPRRVRVNAI